MIKKALFLATALLLPLNAEAVTVSIERTIYMDPTMADNTLDEVQFADEEHIKTHEGIPELNGGTRIWITQSHTSSRLSYIQYFLEATIEGNNVKLRIVVTATTRKNYQRRRARIATCVLRQALSNTLDHKLNSFYKTGSFLQTYKQKYDPPINIRCCRKATRRR